MKFTIDEAAFNHAVQNPFFGSNSPRSAAYGRAAERTIIMLAEDELNVTIRPHAEVSRSAVPQWVSTKTNWLSTKNHDGLVFTNDLRFLGLNETKLKIAEKKTVKLTQNEFQNLKLCQEAGRMYIMSLAEQIEHLDAVYIGAVDMSKHIELFKADKYGNYELKVQEFKNLVPAR